MAEKVHHQKSALKWALIGLLALIVVFSAGAMILVKGIFDKNFLRFDPPKYSGRLQYSDVQNYPRTVVRFKSGKNTLTGYIYGEANRKGLVVIAPGLGEGADTFLAQTLYFVDHGWRVFSFDNTGTYASEGKTTLGLPQSRIDLDAALAYIESSAALKELPIMLWGHSWGGYAVAAVLKDHHEISAVASISGFNAPAGLLAENLKNEQGVLFYVEYPFAWAYQTLLFGGNAFVTAVDGINSADIPVMVIHGDADESISYTGASVIAQRSKITHPNIIYRTCSAKGRNGHNNLYQSEVAAEYIAQKNQEYKVIFDRYQGNVPDSAKAEFYAGVDRFKTSDLDADFMNAINQMYESALVETGQ